MPQKKRRNRFFPKSRLIANMINNNSIDKNNDVDNNSNNNNSNNNSSTNSNKFLYNNKR